MEIISISLDKDELERLNIIQNNLGYTSRSKMLRSTIESLLNEFQTIESIHGNNEAVLIITYKENEKLNVSNILHEFENSIRTTIHRHHSHKCLDIIDINSDSSVIKELFKRLKHSKSIKTANLVILGESK